MWWSPGKIIFVIFYFLIVPPATAQNLEDFADPLLIVFGEIKIGAIPVEVNTLLTSNAYRIYHWQIHERDLRERNDLWDVSLQHFRRNALSPINRGGDDDYIGSDLFIYFVGMKVGCIVYRFWGEGVQQHLRRGDSCILFGGN